MLDLKEFYYSHFNANPEVPIIPGDYALTIPVLTDLHLVLKEPLNRVLFIPRQISLLYNLIDFLEANKIEYFVQAGDLYDRDEATVKTTILNHIEHCISRMCLSRTGYIVKGNHEETYKKHNLFYAYTQVNSDALAGQIMNSQLILPTVPYFKAVDMITIGNANIHFMHFDKEKRYFIKPSDKLNIAIFHDDIQTLESKDKLYHHKHGMGIDIENTNIMENVDVAICAHIHKPMQPFRLNNSRKTLVIVPGSLCQRTRAEDHNHIDMPVICFTKEGNMVMESVKFNLGNIATSINTEKDEKALKQRKIRKEVKKFKERAKSAYSFEDFLEGLPSEERSIVEQADKEIIPKVVAKYYSNNY